ncbi:exosome complex protein Rrp42 [Candidatus Woesearchaeota archaeon]|nr:exosome complex protein Rrp42 [Candidatus Woesearchaeota archaeon]
MNLQIQNHIKQSLDQQARVDGRKLDEFRDLTIEKGVSQTAEGSARVILGETEVIAGVKMSVGEPYPDTPEDGSLMVGAELLPMSSPNFEPGPPSIWAIEIARVVDRGIRESKAIDTKKLCIKKGEKIWLVAVDIITINDDGNLLDAAGIATLAALQDAVFPTYVDGEIDYKKKTKTKLPLSKLPIPVTVYKIGDNLLVDPVSEEEESVDARLTVTTTEKGQICAMQKGGDAPLTIEEIDKMCTLAQKRASELRKKL